MPRRTLLPQVLVMRCGMDCGRVFLFLFYGMAPCRVRWSDGNGHGGGGFTRSAPSIPCTVSSPLLSEGKGQRLAKESSVSGRRWPFPVGPSPPAARGVFCQREALALPRLTVLHPTVLGPSEGCLLLVVCCLGAVANQTDPSYPMANHVCTHPGDLPQHGKAGKVWRAGSATVNATGTEGTNVNS